MHASQKFPEKKGYKLINCGDKAAGQIYFDIKECPKKMSLAQNLKESILKNGMSLEAVLL